MLSRISVRGEASPRDMVFHTSKPSTRMGFCGSNVPPITRLNTKVSATNRSHADKLVYASLLPFAKTRSVNFKLLPLLCEGALETTPRVLSKQVKNWTKLKTSIDYVTPRSLFCRSSISSFVFASLSLQFRNETNRNLGRNKTKKRKRNRIHD